MLNTPFSPWPSFSTEEADAVHRVVMSNKVNYWTGTETREFEKEFAAWCGTAHAVALANGTLADTILFGSFLVWAVLDFRTARKRDRAAAVVRGRAREGPGRGRPAAIPRPLRGWSRLPRRRSGGISFPWFSLPRMLISSVSEFCTGCERAGWPSGPR